MRQKHKQRRWNPKGRRRRLCFCFSQIGESTYTRQTNAGLHACCVGICVVIMCITFFTMFLLVVYFIFLLFLFFIIFITIFIPRHDIVIPLADPGIEKWVSFTIVALFLVWLELLRLWPFFIIKSWQFWSRFQGFMPKLLLTFSPVLGQFPSLHNFSIFASRVCLNTVIIHLFTLAFLWSPFAWNRLGTTVGYMALRPQLSWRFVICPWLTLT